MKKRDISTQTLQEKYNIDPQMLARKKYSKEYTMKIVNRLCEIFNLQPNEVYEIVDD